ncbi:glycosyltransferase [Vibrio natriegens]|uniref:glycosyltransferase family 2 protein n=1 Tax=Vibrio natriegens TaxID=691 RepID=UPI001594B34B|nr:glycosyltransferase family 2 protein [Vibrio natriegens]NVC92210.1 glycosyltransferase [Vibrio natriegens]
MLSVIVPIYNVSKFIPRNIDTLSKQTLKSFEVIFVDDGSKDNSIEVLNDSLDKNEVNFEYTIVKKENGGLSDARNFGLRHAKYNLVSFLDPDDWLSENYYEELTSGLLLNKADVAISSHFEEWNKKTVKTIYSNRCINTQDEKSCLWEYTWSACTKVFKKNLLEEGFDIGIYHEDLAYIPYVISKSNKIYVSEKAIYHYYRHGESILGSHNIEKELHTFKALDKIANRLESKNYQDESNYIALKMLILSFIPLNFGKYKNQRKLLTIETVNYLNNKKITKKEVSKLSEIGYLGTLEKMLILFYLTSPYLGGYILYIMRLIYKVKY